jgi:ADP-heptose:LPS heptosyltransferase/GT2 family glycosyltransferase
MVEKCIDSVIRNSRLEDLQIILTANGSTAAHDYFKAVQGKYPSAVVVVNNEKNEGFIKPNEHALTLCEAEYFVLLNDDLVVHHGGWLDILNAPFKTFPMAALSGPHGTCQSIHYNFHGFCGPEFEYLEGSMLMCKTEIVRKHGLFAPYLEFAYGEDSDLSLRMRRLGYTLHKVEVSFTHAHSQTSQFVKEVPTFQARNHEALKRKWKPYLAARRMDFKIIVRRMAAIGDVLLITPVIEALAKEWPQCEIYVETAIPDLFKGNPYVKGVNPTFTRTYDVWVINLDMVYENRKETHIVDAYFDAIGLDRPKERKTSYYDYQPCIPVEQWVAIGAGPSAWVGKNWPMERWDKVTRWLMDAGYKVKLVGHGNDYIACNRDIRGRTTFSELARELSECCLFIGIDSFPLHMAQAVKVPVIGLFGVTTSDYILTDTSKKLGVSGNPLIVETGSRHRTTGAVVIPSQGESMKSITVEQVIQAVSDITK